MCARVNVCIRFEKDIKLAKDMGLAHNVDGNCKRERNLDAVARATQAVEG
jgi:hypothetical protein